MYINHSGIKGQRKGIRRFQYANKTYTPVGNERYRPKKGGSGLALAGATAIGTTALWAHTVNSATGIGTAMATLAHASLADISAKTIALGAEVVAGFAAIPTPIYALTVPMAIMVAPMLVQSGQDYIERRFGK